MRARTQLTLATGILTVFVWTGIFWALTLALDLGTALLVTTVLGLGYAFFTSAGRR